MALNSKTTLLAALAGVAMAASAVSANAADKVRRSDDGRTQPRSEIGTLSCEIAPAIGVIIGSRQDIDCVFQPARRGLPAERYSGTITKLGVDVGFTNRGTIAWAVWAPTVRPEGFLKGRYVGASANATIGLGIGTNILTGGSWKTISLQPISVQGQRGLGVAAGVSRLRLHYEG